MSSSWDRVYDYARVSSVEQSRGQALDQQIARLERAEPRCDRLFQDVQTGNDRDRPDYQLLKQQVRADVANGLRVLVRVTRLDRLSRDDIEIDSVIEEWDRLGADLLALDGGFYSGKDAPEWLRTKQEAVFAQYYLRQLSSNVRKGKDYKRRMGRPLGLPPFGCQFSKDKTKYEPSPQWADARRLVEGYLPEPIGQGLSLRQLRELAVEVGWDVSISGLRYWLTNPTLRGHLWNREGGLTAAEKKRGVQKPLRITAWNTHEALMSESEFKQIERRLEENRRNWGNTSKRGAVNPLAGLCICGACGCRMRYNRPIVNGKEYCYIKCQYKGCSNTIICPDHIAEKAVQEALIAKARTIAELVNEPDEIEPPELLQLRQQLKNLKAIQASTKLATLQSAIDEISVKIAALEHGGERVDVESSELLAMIAMPSFWDTNEVPAARRKLIYQELVSSVVIIGRSVVAVDLRLS